MTTPRDAIKRPRPPPTRSQATPLQQVCSLLAVVAVLAALGLAARFVLQSQAPAPAPVVLQRQRQQQQPTAAAGGKAGAGGLAPSPTAAAKAVTAAVAGVAAKEIKKAKAPAPKSDKVPAFPDLTPTQIAHYRKAAAVLDPEVIQHIPEAFDDSLSASTPCWRDPKGQPHCLPAFYITGMFHGGALSLAHKLSKHPGVVTDACTNCQFWGEEGKSMAYYLEYMSTAAKRIAASGPAANLMLMDISPSTFAFYWAAGGKAHRGFQESVVACHKECVKGENQGGSKVAACMAAKCYNSSMEADLQRAAKAGIDHAQEAHNPLLVAALYGARPPKMILVARNPLPRLYSAYWAYPHYHMRHGKSAKGFTAYVKEQVAAFRACEADYGAERCVVLFEALGAREEKVHYHCDQLFRGMYSVFLEIWFRFIPPKHWLILNSEDYFANPGATLERTVTFLGLAPVDAPALETMMAGDEGQTKSWVTGQPPMEAEAQAILLELYGPYNERLAMLTGEKRYTEQWNAATAAADGIGKAKASGTAAKSGAAAAGAAAAAAKP